MSLIAGEQRIFPVAGSTWIEGLSDFAVEYSALSGGSDLNQRDMVNVHATEMLGAVEGVP
jgi:hypothetical protein